MTWIELLLTAVALSMDAFAVSTCKGLNLREMSWKRAGIIGLFFGGFQALMPLIVCEEVVAMRMLLVVGVRLTVVSLNWSFSTLVRKTSS